MQASVSPPIREMLIFFTVLTVLHLIGELIIGTANAVDLSHVLDGGISTDSFSFSTRRFPPATT